MRQQTLVLIKPDAVYSGWADAIKKRYLEAGLVIIAQYYFTMGRGRVCDFYAEHTGKFFFKGLILGMSSHPCEALILEGEDAIAHVRTLNGATNPEHAAEGTIRRDFRSAGGVFNTVHGSATEADAEREINLVRAWTS